MNRGFAAIAAMVLLGSVFAGSAGAAVVQDETRQFTVLRDGQPVGQHRMTFRRTGDSLEVTISLNVEVKAGFLPVFVYRHKSREVWHGDRLETLDAETYDNGTALRVRGSATAEGFRVEGPAGTVMAPPDVRPSSFWRRDTTSQSVLLDTEKGRLVRVSAQPVGGSARVQGFKVTGEIDRPVEVWYSENRWTLARFRMLGAQVEFRADDLTPAMAAAAGPQASF
jgi:hypothetical protein